MRVPLVSGPYQARSLIASAQRSVNLFPESNAGDPQAPVPTTTYPVPGTNLFSNNQDINRVVRQVYRATNGKLYAVIGPNVFFIDDGGTRTGLGTIGDKLTTCYFADNGLVIVLVDGTQNGYAINMTDNTFGSIVDPSFQGADYIAYFDSFFVFNVPNTNRFYISVSFADYAMLTDGTGILTGVLTAGGTGYADGTFGNVTMSGGTGSGALATIVVSGGGVTSVSVTTPGVGYTANDVLSAPLAGGTGFTYQVLTLNLAFDPLDIAAKAGGADNIVGIVQSQPYLMLIGALTSEPWYNTGAADFTFGRVPGTFIPHGCVAKYSIVSQDIFVYWISQDAQGYAIVLRAKGMEVQRISTHAIEVDWTGYQNVTDAIAMVYQQQGHTFVIFTFPTDSKTWAYEVDTGQWHERAWTDANGNLKRHRMNCCAFAYNKNLVGDWQNGNIYFLDPTASTDVGNPMVFIRTFPHMLNDGNRAVYNKFIVDIQTGTITDSSEPLLTLRWSDDRGVTFNEGVMKSMGKAGDYIRQVIFWRLGMARDRVFELSWSAPVSTALNGAFIEITPNRT